MAKKITYYINFTEFMETCGPQDERILSNYYDLKLNRDKYLYVAYNNYYIDEDFTPKFRIVANRRKGNIYIEFCALNQHELYLLRTKYPTAKQYLAQLFSDWFYDVKDTLFKIREI